jgi:hypothetical protein
MNVATWRIGRLALILACIGLLALSTTQQAEAADNNPSSNGTAQVQWCESMGGTATVEEHRTAGGGQTMVMVTCSGGLGGSWHCVNFTGANPDCQASRGSLPDWGNLPDAQPLAHAAGSPAAPDAGPSVAAPDDDQKQDTNTSKKGKKSKKSKKGGKGRK